MARISIPQLLRFRYTVLAFPHPKKPSFLPFSSSTAENSEAETTLNCNLNLALLKACQSLRQLVQIHAHLITSGIFPDFYWANRVLLQASDFGDVGYTVLIFRCIKVPNTFCVNRVLKAYSVSTVPHEALIFYFEWLRNGLIPDSYTFLSLFSACANMGCAESGRQCHGQAFKRGLDSVLPLQNSLINMYGCCGNVELAKKVFGGISDRDSVSWNSIVDVYANNGDLNTAHELFDEIPERNVISWNLMIGGYIKGGNPGYALKLFRKMVKAGWRGNNTTVVNVLTACGRSARLNEGKSVHGSIIRTFSNLSIIVLTALIDMYGKCQRVEVACRVFDKMSNRNFVCWNAMIMGHCLNGNPQDGLKLFEQLVGRIRSKYEDRNQIVRPDEITFIAVLCACARAGLLTEARNYSNEMINVFLIKPSFAHYWCMANVFASAGLNEKAEEILRNLSENNELPTSESLVWANLLASCRFHGDVSIGEQLARSLIDMEPRNVLYYRLLLNIYAVAGRWEDVARVKETVKEIGLGRMPGCNLIDLKEIVHDLRVPKDWGEGTEKVLRKMNEVT